MKIIAGKHRGRSILSPTGPGVRPTSSKMREAMFDILVNNGYLIADETKVVDLCCGTGALGLEALSRGAIKVIFIDGSREHLNLARQNIYYLGEQDKSVVLRADAEKLLNAQEQFDLVFIDPPYLKGVASKALVALNEKNWLNPDAIIVVEIAKSEELRFDSTQYKEITTRIHGNSKFLLLEKL